MYPGGDTLRECGARTLDDATLQRMEWPVVRASGGPRDRGRIYGEAARDRVHGSIELYEAVFHHYTRLSWTEVRNRAGAFAPWFDDTDEQLLPELEGIAEGAGVDAEDVLALNVRTEVMFGLDSRTARAAAKECTAIGAASTICSAPEVPCHESVKLPIGPTDGVGRWSPSTTFPSAA